MIKSPQRSEDSSLFGRCERVERGIQKEINRNKTVVFSAIKMNCTVIIHGIGRRVLSLLV
jgi:hypothetical protein